MVERSTRVEAPCVLGGRRVCLGEQVLGTVYSLHDLTLLLRQAGLGAGDELDVAESDLIEWHGGGPEVWPRQGGGPECWTAPSELPSPVREVRRA
ncbi:hypothetical protein ACFV2Z_34265 [Streptomyces sp. NPDC059688]|uniref:hypothetical protein n=1 Tax=Streptomyces sp. NPDC059688 TaxID=3346906 RepID=UPI0036786351